PYTNVAAMFEASGSNFDNIALYAYRGKAILNDALLNGSPVYEVSLSAGQYVEVDPTMYETVAVTYGNSGSVGVQVKKTGLRYELRNGKELTIMTLNDVNNNFFVMNTLRNRPNYRINGGTMLTIKYIAGQWYIKSQHD